MPTDVNNTNSSDAAATGSDNWLCAGGPYEEYISKLSSWNPGLNLEDPENVAAPFALRDVKATLLTVDEKGRYHRAFDTEISKDVNLLKQQLKSREGLKNVWLIVNINPDVVALLGEHFKMHPDFFVQYERSSKWRRWADEPNLTPGLPSLISNQRYAVLNYCDLRDFGPINSYNVSCLDTGRSVLQMKQRGEFVSPSTIDRKCAYWHRTVKDGWDVVILCDPPLRRVVVWSRSLATPGSYDTWEEAIKNDRPFQGGYCDFMPQEEELSDIAPGPPKDSLHGDLCHYLLNRAQALPSRYAKEEYRMPILVLQKIVASHYMQLMTFTTAHLIHNEWPLMRRDSLQNLDISWAEARWSEIQEVMMRCNYYISSLESLFVDLRIPLDEPKLGPLYEWWDVKPDFQHILRQAKTLKSRAADLNNAFTGLTGIVGNAQAHQEAKRSLVEAKRSVREAKNMKVLTFVAMLFIPLAFTCGLFSMSDSYIPGERDFWVFFAVSIPLVVLVFAGAFVVNLGYNEDGDWMWKTFNHGVKNAVTMKKKDGGDHSVSKEVKARSKKHCKKEDV